MTLEALALVLFVLLMALLVVGVARVGVALGDYRLRRRRAQRLEQIRFDPTLRALNIRFFR
jgi:hypothetical protein